MRLNGINRKENEHIKLGQHHTIELELNRPVHIHKENWDSVDLVNDSNTALCACLFSYLHMFLFIVYSRMYWKMRETRPRKRRLQPWSFKRGWLPSAWSSHRSPKFARRLSEPCPRRRRYCFEYIIAVLVNTLSDAKGNKSHATAMNKFFEDIYQAMKSNINFDFVKVVLVGR